ncbi:MAG: hypothetical protein HZA10_10015 [Nitrospirae bacterium]|nr:hypothetical protein [Nitrospirota bacterium]
MEIFLFVTVNLLLFYSWHALLYRRRGYLLFADRVSGALLLCLSQIILTEMALGSIFKKLHAAPLFILNIIISLGVLSFCSAGGKLNYRDVFGEIKDNASRLLNIIKDSRILLIISILFSLYLCYLIFIGFLFPSYTWDALLYHLPIMGYILQSGAIEQIPDYSLIYTFLNIFPKNIELFFLWNVMFLKTAAVVDLSQMFFVFIGMLSIYGMAVKLKVEKKYAALSALLFFFAPVVIQQSTIEYVDLAVSALFLTAINFLLYICASTRDTAKYRSVPVLLAGAAAGILLGSKGSGALFIAALLAMITASETKKWLSMRSDGLANKMNLKTSIIKNSSYFILPVILFGSYWYIQNWLHYKNPVYPFVVRVFDKVIFDGILTEILDSVPQALENLSPAASLLQVWLEKESAYIYSAYLSGFGALWFILFLPAVIFSLAYAIKEKRYDFLLIAAVAVFTFALSPRNWNPRYVIFIFGFGSLSFAFLLNRIGEKSKAPEFLALIFVLYTIFTSNSLCITPNKIKEFAQLPAKERTLAKMNTPCLSTQKGDYGMWSWINANVSAGKTLAYTFEPLLTAPLWNNNFSNRIIYLRGKNIVDWHENLHKNNAAYALILRKSIENWWLTELEKFRHIPRWETIYNEFKIVYSDKEYIILKIAE